MRVAWVKTWSFLLKKFQKFSNFSLNFLFQAHFDVVKILIEHGADVNASNAEGDTVLHFAISGGKLSMLFIFS